PRQHMSGRSSPDRRGRIVGGTASFLSMTSNRTAAAVVGLATPARDSVSRTADPSWRRREARRVQIGLVAGMIAQLLLVTGLLGIVSLSGNGLGAGCWIV